MVTANLDGCFGSGRQEAGHSLAVPEACQQVYASHTRTVQCTQHFVLLGQAAWAVEGASPGALQISIPSIL